MSRSIQDIEGIGPRYANILNDQGIYTTSTLLEAGSHQAGRKALAEKTSISESSLLKWVNMCDLFRIKGVAGQYAELLESAGVDTVKELRNRNAENLASKMREVNAIKNLCRINPTVKMVDNWIDQAKTLEPMVFH